MSPCVIGLEKAGMDFSLPGHIWRKLVDWWQCLELTQLKPQACKGLPLGGFLIFTGDDTPLGSKKVMSSDFFPSFAIRRSCEIVILPCFKENQNCLSSFIDGGHRLVQNSWLDSPGHRLRKSQRMGQMPWTPCCGWGPQPKEPNKAMEHHWLTKKEQAGGKPRTWWEGQRTLGSQWGC